MGRPRKPTAQLATTGAFEKNPSRLADRATEPQASGAPFKPAYLTDKAGRVWDELAPLCVAMGTLATCDSYEFATYCWLEAEFQNNPSRMTSAMIAQKRAYGERFGLSAGARAKMGVKDESGETKDPTDKYFKDLGSSKQICQ